MFILNHASKHNFLFFHTWRQFFGPRLLNILSEKEVVSFFLQNKFKNQNIENIEHSIRQDLGCWSELGPGQSRPGPEDAIPT